jgi:hypothetical protein
MKERRKQLGRGESQSAAALVAGKSESVGTLRERARASTVLTKGFG